MSGVCTKNEQQRSPLNECSGIQSLPLDVTKVLVDRFPECVSLADTDDNRGLHIACKCKSASETIQLLAQACPASVNIKNNQGTAPLALACEADASLCDIFALLSLDPTLSLA